VTIRPLGRSWGPGGNSLRGPAAVAAVLVAQALGGCGAGDSDGPRPSQDPGTVKTSDAAVRATLRGTVQEGVEQGCLVLRTGGRVYLLDGAGAGELVAGRAVVVTGVARPELATSCMQGIPFDVETVEPAG